jgi:Kef-type K+ transport system membrane component KefB
VVPADYSGYFTATVAAAGVLIGLLFVAVSLRPDTIFGDGAPPAGLAQAGSAFTCLVDCFFISLVALIPGGGLGVVSVILAVTSIVATLRLHREVARQELQLAMLVLSLATYLYQLVIGIILVLHGSATGQVSSVAYLEIALFSVALRRAWSLVQGKHLRPSPSRAGPVHSGDAPSS